MAVLMSAKPRWIITEHSVRVLNSSQLPCGNPSGSACIDICGLGRRNMSPNHSQLSRWESRRVILFVGRKFLKNCPHWRGNSFAYWGCKNGAQTLNLIWRRLCFEVGFKAVDCGSRSGVRSHVWSVIPVVVPALRLC